MSAVFKEINVCVKPLMRAGLVIFFTLSFMLPGCIHVADQCHEKKTETSAIPPETTPLLSVVDYCTMTNVVALLEKIHERRCFQYILWERGGSEATKAMTQDTLTLSDDWFSSWVLTWLERISNWQDYVDDIEEFISLLTAELEFDSLPIYIWTSPPSNPVSHEDYINKWLDDDERYRFLALTLKYKAKLSSIVNERFEGMGSQRMGN